MLKPVPIVGGAYSDDCQPWTHQDTCNWLPVVAEGEGARSSGILRTPPGLQEFATLADATRQRGGYVAEGRLLVVIGTVLYQVMPDASIRALGTVPGTSRVQFTHNKVGSNIEVFIGAGSWGGIYSSDADTLTQITDEGFHGAKAVGYIGHLFLAVDPSGREFQNSDLDDGANWNALETYQGESKPDRIVSLAVANGEVVLLNERSLDHFAYTGETNALFQNKLIPIDRGCGAKDAVSLMDNALFFIGDDGSGYEKRGYELRRITTHAIEQAWSRAQIAKAYSFTWEDRGHKVWYVTFPDGFTWGYDVASRQWHRRFSGLDECARWRLAWLVKWNGDWYGGEFNSGRIFKLVWGYVLEGSERIRRLRTSGVLHDNQNRLTLHTVEPVVEATGQATVATTVTPQIVTSGWWLTTGSLSDLGSNEYYRLTLGGEWLGPEGRDWDGDVTDYRIFDFRYLGARIVEQNWNGSEGDYGILTNPDHVIGSGDVDTHIVNGLPYDAEMLRRDCVNTLVGYGCNLLTVDGGVTLTAIAQPDASILDGEVLQNLVRTGTGRWLGIGLGATGREFVYTDEATPTAMGWTNLGQLPNEGGIDIGGANTEMDASPTAVVCTDSGFLFRSTDDGETFDTVQDISEGSTKWVAEVKWLTGNHWIASTFDAMGKTGSGDRIWTSDDDGETWTVSASSGSVIPPASRLNFTYGDGDLYAGALTGAFSDSQGLYKSTNYGVTWTEVALPTDFPYVGANAQPLMAFVGDGR